MTRSHPSKTLPARFYSGLASGCSVWLCDDTPRGGLPTASRLFDVTERRIDDAVERPRRRRTEAAVLWFPDVPRVKEILAHLRRCYSEQLVGGCGRTCTHHEEQQAARGPLSIRTDEPEEHRGSGKVADRNAAGQRQLVHAPVVAPLLVPAALAPDVAPPKALRLVTIPAA